MKCICVIIILFLYLWHPSNVLRHGLNVWIYLFQMAATNSPCLWLSDRSLRQILKGPCKLVARSMCAMAHSHARFIPLLVLIMSAFYLLCEAGGKEALNKAASPAVNLQGEIVRFGPTVAHKFQFLLTLLIYSLLLLCSSLYTCFVSHILSFTFFSVLHFVTVLHDMTLTAPH